MNAVDLESGREARDERSCLTRKPQGCNALPAPQAELSVAGNPLSLGSRRRKAGFFYAVLRRDELKKSDDGKTKNEKRRICHE